MSTVSSLRVEEGVVRYQICLPFDLLLFEKTASLVKVGTVEALKPLIMTVRDRVRALLKVFRMTDAWTGWTGRHAQSCLHATSFMAALLVLVLLM